MSGSAKLEMVRSRQEGLVGCATSRSNEGVVCFRFRLQSEGEESKRVGGQPTLSFQFNCTRWAPRLRISVVCLHIGSGEGDRSNLCRISGERRSNRGEAN
jgi:hypothetical protein